MNTYTQKQITPRDERSSKQNYGDQLPPQLASNQAILQMMSQQNGDSEQLYSPSDYQGDPNLLAKIKRRFTNCNEPSPPTATGEQNQNTGIPAHTKQKFEERSGFSYDDVKVHYNSDKPVELGALAYTQGNQVYIGPGQEEHLEHELGHVAQQKAGMVRATGSVDGNFINNDLLLEHRADSSVIQKSTSDIITDSSNIIQFARTTNQNRKRQPRQRIQGAQKSSGRRQLSPQIIRRPNFISALLKQKLQKGNDRRHIIMFSIMKEAVIKAYYNAHNDLCKEAEFAQLAKELMNMSGVSKSISCLEDSANIIVYIMNSNPYNLIVDSSEHNQSLGRMAQTLNLNMGDMDNLYKCYQTKYNEFIEKMMSGSSGFGSDSVSLFSVSFLKNCCPGGQARAWFLLLCLTLCSGALSSGSRSFAVLTGSTAEIETLCDKHPLFYIAA